MKFNNLFLVIFTVFLFTFFSCQSGLKNIGFYEIKESNGSDDNNSQITTHYDGLVYLSSDKDYIKVFPKSDVMQNSGKIDLIEGKILFIDKKSFFKNKLEKINIDDNFYFPNQLGNIQFYRLKLPYYIINFNSTVTLEYYNNENKITEIKTILHFISNSDFYNYYGFFIPLNINWNINKIKVGINISSDKKINIKIIKNIYVKVIDFIVDTVFFDKKKTDEFFNYNMEKIILERKIKYDIWGENNNYLYLFNGYGFPVIDEFGISSNFGDARILKGYNGRILSPKSHHTGLDISKRYCDFAYATADGIIRLTKYNELFGNTLIIEHGFGLFTTYYHLEKFFVKEGDIVLQYDTEELLYDIEKAESKYSETSAKLDVVRQNSFNDVKS